MAKKKTTRVTTTSALHVSNVSQLPVKGGDGLPEYQRYYTCEHFRFFFESPESKSEILSDRTNICCTKRSFNLLSEGKALVGHEIAQTFCRLIIGYFGSGSPTGIRNLNQVCESLFKYLASLDKTPARFQEITFSIYSRFVLSQSSTAQAGKCKATFQKLLSLHPFTKSFNISSISYFNHQNIPINEVDKDSLLDEKDYSDRILMQILACSFYELDIWKKRYELMLNTTKDNLGENYVENYSQNNVILKELLTNGKNGYDKLFSNFMYGIKQERAGHKTKNQINQSQLIPKALRGIHYNGLDPKKVYRSYQQYMADKMWNCYSKSTNPIYQKYLSFNTAHLPAILALYLMISTGKNRETILSIKRNYGKKSWFENFDVNLGIDETTVAAQKEIRVIGYKNRGVMGKKPISIRIPINSPVFEYMKLYDDIANDPNRDDFFTLNPNSLSKIYTQFCASFEILDDDDKQLNSIQTPRLRKTFAGHLLMDLVEDVDNSEELVSKLREALNHQAFDTTLFSYIMKTGMGNHVINAAIVALTTNMINKAMVFQGSVCEDIDRSPTNKEVYLCDCTDNTRPTHNIPIAERCKKYDMCLGCERAEVYAMHLPRITYRIMQYDKIALENPLTFSGLLEDRRQIALDTINTFRNEHGRGIEVVEHAYFEATKAMKEGIPLLPAIIQFQ
jgi:hypothetical protein